MKARSSFPFKGSLPILYRDMTVFWRSIYSEVMTTAATPLTFFVIFALGMKGYIRDVGGVSYICLLYTSDAADEN